MRLTIEIEVDNAAFHGDDEQPYDNVTLAARDLDRYALRLQVEKITGAIAARLEDGETIGICWDSNGNTVGNWVLS